MFQTSFQPLGLRCAAFVLAAFFAISQTHAAIITWSGTTLSGTGISTINTSGSLVEAHDVAGGPVTAGGVTFDALKFGGLGLVFAGANPTNITGNANFDLILNTASYAGSSVTYTIDSLISGMSYLVQFFVADSREGIGNVRTVTVQDNSGGTSLTSATLGQGFVFTGTFTAIGTTQDVLFGGNVNVPYMNAWQLREIAPLAVAVPEPASLAIWVVGALGCAFAGYRRRRTI